MQAALLPKLARLAGAGQEEEFRKALRQLVMIVLAVGLIGVVGGFAVGHVGGPPALRHEVHARATGTSACSRSAAAAFIFALTLAQALIALRSYAAAALSWLAGVVGCVVGAVVAHDLFLRSELSFAIGAPLRGGRDARRASPCACARASRWGRWSASSPTSSTSPSRSSPVAPYTCSGVSIERVRDELVEPEHRAPALLRLARPKQWAKNVLVVAAPGAAGVLTHGQPAFRTAVAFVCFCLAASSTYFLNDAIDVEADRQHPRKRTRPVASGEVSRARPRWWAASCSPRPRSRSRSRRAGSSRS